MHARRVHLRDPGGRHEYPWNLPFERAVHHLPLGMIDIRVLEQGKLWVDSAGHARRLRDLGDEHLENVIAMLRLRALSLLLDYSMAAGLGRFRPGLRLPSPAGGADAVAARWLRATPLWRALHVEVAVRERRRPGARRRLDGTEGICALRTEGATFVLDAKQSVLLTVPPPAETQATVPQWEALDALPRVRVGRPFVVAGRRRSPSAQGRSHDRRLADVIVWIRPLPLNPDVGAGTVASAARLATRSYTRLRLEYLETTFRTARFMTAAGDVRAMWAAVDAVLESAGIAGATLVPTRLRSPAAHESSVDLLIECASAQRERLEAEVAAALGYRLPVTLLADYAPLSLTTLEEHGMRLTPGLGGFNRSSQHRHVSAIVGARRGPRRGCASRGSCGVGS